MSKNTKEKRSNDQNTPSDAWLSMRSGLIVITVVSLGMTLFTIWQTYDPAMIGESITYGLVRGGSIWVIFIGAYLLNRWLRGSP